MKYKANQFKPYTVKGYINAMKKGKMDFDDLPSEYKYNRQIVDFQRKLGVRTVVKKGYDVLYNQFFIIEHFVNINNNDDTYRRWHYFDNFEEYFDFLDGNIYENACYYKYNFESDIVKKHNLDTNKLNCGLIKVIPEEYEDKFYNKLMSYQRKTDNSKIDTYIKTITKKCSSNNTFYVIYKWFDGNECVDVKQYEFDLFYEFVSFLNNDLSNADLLFCKGLRNIKEYTEIKFDGAIMTSYNYDHFGIKYKTINIEKKIPKYYSSIKCRENQNNLVCNHSSVLNEHDFAQIYYISDLHIEHNVNLSKVRSVTDLKYIMDQIVLQLKEDDISIAAPILIAGDLSENKNIWETYLYSLQNKFRNPIICVLGNHELWDTEKGNLKELINKKKKFALKNNIYLLQNDLLYINDYECINIIQEHEILSMNKEEIRERVKKARIIIFGGIGFSGLNEEFNANSGVYNMGLNRDEEINQSKQCSKVYHKLCDCIPDKKLIVLTHMPFYDWCEDKKYHNEYVYISGHTHKNYFYDNNKIRIYADNQLGYKPRKYALKYLYVNSKYDTFVDYKDGIYNIDKEKYIDFNRGKNICISFSRKYQNLYMLKKQGFYMFIMETLKGTFCILNGGAIKSLPKESVEYFYKHMNEVIDYLQYPLNAYTELQNKLSQIVKEIGGEGTIHGCIINIDFYNHLYVNPLDGYITYYYAKDMIDKIIYPNISDLLRDNCPTIYKNYQKYICEQGDTELIILKNNLINIYEKTKYLDTDIYSMSREINKIQKIKNNILTTWVNCYSKDIY